jgi:spore coat polysaccharide biosynthesis protein SpsF
VKVVAIVQARMGSTRLPGKVLADIAGRPMLAWVLERLGCAETLDEIVVATSTKPVDDAIEALCEDLELPVFRGSEEDVIDRYLRAAARSEAVAVVRVTGDCPLIDPGVVDRVVRRYLEGGADYVSNTVERSYPRGLDVEVFSREALETAAGEARLPWERVHVTPYLYRHPGRFRVAQVQHDSNESWRRWTVDTEADLRFVRLVFDRLEDPGVATWLEVLEILRADPGLELVNREVIQKALNEG